MEDSIITFNWDLLIDDYFIRRTHDLPHYTKFKAKFSEVSEDDYEHVVAEGAGLFLKLHGSVNWFQCTNAKCTASKGLIFRKDTDRCLGWSMGIDKSYICQRCGSESNPLIVPPVLRKPIVEQETIRATWGLARNVLANAAVLVVIGFSVAPTDYYASWLLREAAADRFAPLRQLEEKPPMRIIVVNPLNDPKKEGHDDFRTRMNKLFPQGYDSQFRSFAEIGAICAKAKKDETLNAAAAQSGTKL